MMSLPNHIATLAIASFLLSNALVTPNLLQAQVQPLGQRGCATGTVVGGTNLVTNGDFSTDAGAGPGINPAAGFSSALRNRGPNTYPSDEGGGGFSIQHGPQTYRPHNDDSLLIVGRTFPGDSQRDVLPTETYFYSNPRYDTSEVLLWQQEVNNLAPGTTYNFFAYVDNLLETQLNGTADPRIELRVDNQAAGPAITVAQQPEGWVPIQFAFTTGNDQTKVTLAIYDLANSNFGDDFGITQINLKQCAAALGVAKSVGQPTRVEANLYDVPYTILVKNYGVDPQPVQGIQVTDDLQAAFARAVSFSVVSVSSDRFHINQSYNGRTDMRLLDGTDALGSGDQVAIQLTVRVRIGSELSDKGPYNNSAQVTAISGNVQVEDDSVAGSTPDVNGDGDPKESTEDRPTTVIIGGAVYVPVALKR